MKTTNKLGPVLGMVAALALAGCANMNGTPYPPNPNVASQGNTYSVYGVVHSIDIVQQGNNGIAGSSVGIGTIAGAVIGGVLGNQVGRGRGNTVAKDAPSHATRAQNCFSISS